MDSKRANKIVDEMMKKARTMGMVSGEPVFLLPGLADAVEAGYAAALGDVKVLASRTYSGTVSVLDIEKLARSSIPSPITVKGEWRADSPDSRYGHYHFPNTEAASRNPVQQEEIRKDKVAKVAAKFVNRLVSEGKAFKTEWIKDSEFSKKLSEHLSEESEMQVGIETTLFNLSNQRARLTPQISPNTTRGGHPVFIPYEKIKAFSIPVVWEEIT